MPPKVSVIVPNYNHAPYLRQRLDSIFYQSLQDFEVIILDDCSTDNSKEIIEEYRNRPQISHIVYNKTNSGSPFKQWAKGFELAKGEYIWIAESDDWAKENFLKKTTTVLSNKKHVNLVFCNSVWTFSNKFEYKPISHRDFLLTGQQFIKKYMIATNSVYNASCALFRRDDIKKIPTEYQFYKGCGDWLFWLEICLLGDVFYIAEPLNYYRQHTSSTTVIQRLNGNTFLELLNIFKYQKNKMLISPYMKNCIPVLTINHLKKQKKQSKDNTNFYNKIIAAWKREVLFLPLSRLIVFTGNHVWHTFRSLIR